MKSSRAPAIALLLLWLGFAASIFFSISLLPERVATHFNFDGDANDWMSRGTHLTLMSILGIVLPLLFVGVSMLIRVVPASVINIPRRDYWLAAERKGGTYRLLTRRSLWLACVAVCFIIGLQAAIVLANRQSPAHLSGPLIWSLAGIFIAAVLAWCASLLWHFRYGE